MSGLSDFARISSKDTAVGNECPNGGTNPVREINSRKDTCLNPRIGTRGTSVPEGTWTLADPVPVRRPGVRVMDVDVCRRTGLSGIDSGIGMTNVGLKLFAALVNYLGAKIYKLYCKPQDLKP